MAVLGCSEDEIVQFKYAIDETGMCVHPNQDAHIDDFYQQNLAFAGTDQNLCVAVLVHDAYG
jgi:hypothetical protein